MSMLAKLKDTKIILALLLVVSWIVAGLTCYFIYSSKDKQITELKEEVATLQKTMTDMGDLVPAYVLQDSVEMGEKVEDKDFTEVQVPSTLATGMIQDITDLEGKNYRMDLKGGTALTQDDLSTDKITDDMRLLDVVLNTIPVGLKPNTYVDIRMTMPDGKDYIAISHKQVKDINSGVLKVAVNEHDIHTYNSMLIDSLMYVGSQMYAVEYVEGGIQKASDTYYPLSKKIATLANKDPNLLTAIKADILKKRKDLEGNLTSVTDGENITQIEIDTILEGGREKFRDAYNEASIDYNIKEEREAEKAREAEINGSVE